MADITTNVKDKLYEFMIPFFVTGMATGSVAEKFSEGNYREALGYSVVVFLLAGASTIRYSRMSQAYRSLVDEVMYLKDENARLSGKSIDTKL